MRSSPAVTIASSPPANTNLVRNRDRWTIDTVHRNGDLTVSGPSGSVRLPNDYVQTHVELGYAQTSHATQGRTVDRSILYLCPIGDLLPLHHALDRLRRDRPAVLRPRLEACHPPPLRVGPRGAEPASVGRAPPGVPHQPGPWTYGHHDAVLGCLRRGGLSLEVTALAYALLDSYVYGFALQEVNLPATGDAEMADLDGTLIEPLPGACSHT